MTVTVKCTYIFKGMNLGMIANFDSGIKEFSQKLKKNGGQAELVNIFYTNKVAKMQVITDC